MFIILVEDLIVFDKNGTFNQNKCYLVKKNYFCKNDSINSDEKFIFGKSLYYGNCNFGEKLVLPKYLTVIEAL